MRIRIAEKDLEFLRRVRELGLQGRTQVEIAEAIELPISSLRNRLSDLGFRFVGVNDLETTLTRDRFSELDFLSADDAPAAEPAGVTA